MMALVKGSCEGIGAQSLLEDMGMGKCRLGGYTDATAAIGIAQRAGVGRTRHIDVAMLWIQQKILQEWINVAKVCGLANPADMFTKHVPQEVCVKHMHAQGFQHREGRAEKAVDVA